MATELTAPRLRRALGFRDLFLFYLYFPSLLYFAAGNALFIDGSSWQTWSTDRTYFIVTAVAGLTIAVTMNVVGLNVGKWLSNVGAMAAWEPMALLIIAGAVAWARFGAATPITSGSLVPSTSVKDAIFWSTIAFGCKGTRVADSYVVSGFSWTVR